MKKIMSLGLAGCFALLVAAAPAARAEDAARPQIAAGAVVTISAEIVAVDAVKRTVTFRGPLGGLTSASLTDEVTDLSKFKIGDAVSVSYYEAVAVSVRRQGDAKPLFSASDAAVKAEPAGNVRATNISSKSVSVVSIDLTANSLVLQGVDGTLYVIDVVRPEFQAKLKDLRPGDQVDVSYSEALVTGITPLAPGDEAKVTMKTGTLVIDQGEIVKRTQNVLMIRNERGRMVKVAVDGKFKFKLNGKEVTVYDLKEGTRLTRTALRVTEVSY